MSYTNIFGGYNINTAFPSYMNYVIQGNLQLNWASSFVDTVQGTNNVTAQINDVAGSPPIVITNNNPISTTLGSGVVIVTIPPNPSLVTGNMVTIAGATTTNGITNVQLNITAAITVINATSFSYVTAGTAGGGPFTGGGNAVTYRPLPTVTLADATMISVGETIQFNNVGSDLVTILNFTGGQIVQIPPTALANQYILYLQDNSTQAGTWGITQLGAGTSQAQANALAGPGTISLNSQINTNFPGKSIGANYVVQLDDRASILIWTGGAGTITLPPQLNGYYIAVNNEGSGVVTINTPDATTIDGNASLGINPSGSSYIIGVTGNWNTLGNGIETFFKVQSIVIPLTNTNINLTTAQATPLVQRYTGDITANIIVFYPAVAGQWYVWNDTSGPFTLSVQLIGPTGNLVQIPQGEKVIIYSDQTSLYNTPTIATSAVFPDGSPGSPGINFQAQSTTGFYRSSSGLVGYSSAGTASLGFGGPIPGFGLAILGGQSLQFLNASNSNYVGFQAPALPTGVTWTLPAADGANGSFLQTNGAATLSFTATSFPSATTANQLLYSPANNVIAGLPTANNGVLVTSAGGVPSISSTLPVAVQNNITSVGIVNSGTWQATPVTVQFGGTGRATLTTAYGVVCAGTTPTGPLQNAGPGLTGQLLVSNGAAALPSWQNSLPLSAAALFYWNGAAVVTLSSTNCTITRNSTGNFNCTFTTFFASPNYNFSSMGSAGTGALIIGYSGISYTPTTSQFNLSTLNATSLVPFDPNSPFSIQFFGVLA